MTDRPSLSLRVTVNFNRVRYANHSCIANRALMCATGSASVLHRHGTLAERWHTTQQTINDKALIRLPRCIRHSMPFCTQPFERGVRVAFMSAVEDRDHRLAAATSQQNRFPKCLIAGTI